MAVAKALSEQWRGSLQAIQLLISGQADVVQINSWPLVQAATNNGVVWNFANNGTAYDFANSTNWVNGLLPISFVVRMPNAVLTAEELVAHCRKEMTAYKTPRDVQFVEALPGDMRTAQVVSTMVDLCAGLDRPTSGQVIVNGDVQLLINTPLGKHAQELYKAFDAAREDVARFGSLEVPARFRNAPTRLMKNLGYGKDYRYAHDEPDAFAAGESYFPEGMPAVECVLRLLTVFRPDEQLGSAHSRVHAANVVSPDHGLNTRVVQNALGDLGVRSGSKCRDGD